MSSQCIERCLHCDTPLRFSLDDGRQMRFVAHDDAFCALATRDRVRMLLQLLEEQRTTFVRKLEDVHRRMDAILEEAGLPTLAQRAEAAAIEAKLLEAKLRLAADWLPDLSRPRKPG